MSAQKKEIFLADYAVPDFLISHVDLEVAIFTTYCEVSTRLKISRNAQSTHKNAPLILDGEQLETLLVAVDDTALTPENYLEKEGKLTIHKLPDFFTLCTKVKIYPHKNTTLSGFYQSQNGLFTQCEAEGFRRITWFLDRPDVMSEYTVTLSADKTHFPVLLANGNPVNTGEINNNRHFATWHDPFKKPCYLFAMVAADLAVLEDEFTTSLGKKVALRIYTEQEKLNQCAHAMRALKLAMAWDEQKYGLACDLDNYTIVAVADFNMGAMENKGLNIFNTKFVLARPEIATDLDYENIDRVIAHEYFHNWTGNRVTCRDWFSLSLKEGLTVFRDQQFGFDTHCQNIARIKDVRALRAAQFPEDASNMAHPVRPNSYIEINNFYTMTIYEKGAEVVRMIHTIVGEAAFLRGMQIYFARFDGCAVTCDDFVHAMKEAYIEVQKVVPHKADLLFAQFMRWYDKKGTPQVFIKSHFDADKKQFSLHLTQVAPYFAQEKIDDDFENDLFVIPIQLALLNRQGEALKLGNGEFTTTFLFHEKEAILLFDPIQEPPIPSLLRDFSAPIILNYDYKEEELALLMATDSDAFNRFEAAQRLYTEQILEAMQRLKKNEKTDGADALKNSIKALLKGFLEEREDAALLSEILTIPSEATLFARLKNVDIQSLIAAREALLKQIAQSGEIYFLEIYQSLNNINNLFSSENAGKRALRNLCLAYLNELKNKQYVKLAEAQFEQSANMTEQFAALTILVAHENGENALNAFYEKWQNEALVVDKWLSVQAASRAPNTLEKVRELTKHKAFRLTTPNNVYALLRTFTGNLRHFHAKNGAAYAFIAEQISALDTINPQVAARLLRAFDRIHVLEETQKNKAREILQSLRTPQTSNDVREIIEKIMA